KLDVLGRRGLVEARPAGSGLELRTRAEELRSAARTPVGPVLFDVPVLARERRLGAVATEDVVLLGCQTLTPLLVGEVHVSLICLVRGHVTTVARAGRRPISAA